MFPFTRSELTAALRHYLDEASLDVAAYEVEVLSARPARGKIRQVGIDLDRAGHREHYSYILKEPHGMTTSRLAGSGHREIGLYRALSSQLPIAVPQLVGADANGKWLLLEPYLTEVAAEEWGADDYRQAVINLARLHDRFWGLNEDLSVYPWLGRPLAEDFETHTLASAKAMESIIVRSSPTLVTGSLNKMAHIAVAISHADQIAQALRAAPQTLLHGDYWAGNISIDEDHEHILYDWQMVSLGPGILDLVAFICNSTVWLRLPIDALELIRLYREQLARLGRPTWTDEEWNRLWDFALIWRFIQEWLLALAVEPTPLTERQLVRVNRVWIEPMIAAVKRRIDDPAITDTVLNEEIKQIDEMMRDDP